MSDNASFNYELTLQMDHAMRSPGLVEQSRVCGSDPIVSVFTGRCRDLLLKCVSELST